MTDEQFQLVLSHLRGLRAEVAELRQAILAAADTESASPLAMLANVHDGHGVADASTRASAEGG